MNNSLIESASSFVVLFGDSSQDLQSFLGGNWLYYQSGWCLNSEVAGVCSSVMMKIGDVNQVRGSPVPQL